MARSRVTGYCVARAGCPVITVPPPALARDLGHGPVAWAFWHRSLTPEQVLARPGQAARLKPARYRARHKV